jgi:hypothetical protein
VSLISSWGCLSLLNVLPVQVSLTKPAADGRSETLGELTVIPPIPSVLRDGDSGRPSHQTLY